MKFKKHIIFILSFLLLVSNTGLAFNVHYCGDKIASISLKSSIPSPDINNGCCEKITDAEHSCCKNKVFHFQQKQDTLISKIFAIHFDYSFIYEEWNPTVFSFVSNFKKSKISTYYSDANAPPLYKLYSQYIFYA